MCKTFRKILSKTCIGVSVRKYGKRRLANWQREKSKASMFFKKAFSSHSSVEVNFLADGGGRRRPLAWLMAKSWKVHNSRPKIVCSLDFAAFLTILNSIHTVWLPFSLDRLPNPLFVSLVCHHSPLHNVHGYQVSSLQLFEEADRSWLRLVCLKANTLRGLQSYWEKKGKSSKSWSASSLLDPVPFQLTLQCKNKNIKFKLKS